MQLPVQVPAVMRNELFGKQSLFTSQAINQAWGAIPSGNYVRCQGGGLTWDCPAGCSCGPVVNHVGTCACYHTGKTLVYAE